MRFASFKSVMMLGCTLLVSGCKFGVLTPAGPVGSADATIMLDSLAIMLAIVIPTIIAVLVFAWWFRESNMRAHYMPDFVYSGRIEFVVWSIPILVILFLGGIIWVGSHDLDPYRPLRSIIKPMDVQVVSLDWKWLFIYPNQGVASVNELVVPAGTPIHFYLTSASVMNVFFVPRLGSMIYTMNGMVTQLHLEASHVGDFHGLSAHFSGDGFPGMQFTVHAVSPAAYGEWVRAAKSRGPTLDAHAYLALEEQSSNVPPMTYRAVTPTLFHQIATQALPPGPGPKKGEPGPAVRPVAEK
jgi:cytochrome o ubiquinol oxidase subunit 2